MNHDLENLPDLWICGGSFVERYASAGHPDPGDAVWRWQAADEAIFDEETRGRYISMDEVKPVTLENGEEAVLVCSSEGGVALIARASGRLLFSGECYNAHSVELLPGGFIAVAGSTGTDRVQL